MTIAEAVDILNGKRHRGSDRWHLSGGVVAAAPIDLLTPFEAVAIAAAYRTLGSLPEPRVECGGRLVPRSWTGMLERGGV